jgi:type IV secretory pathway VirB10-like protein
MTDPEALADADLMLSGYHNDDFGGDDFGGDDFGGDDWDSYAPDDWQRNPGEPAQPARSSWFRNPRLLFGLIAVAAAALVVATVLLITGKQSGEIPSTPELSSRATPSARSTPRQPFESTPSTPPSPPLDAETPSPSVEETAAPVEPEPAAEPPAPAPPSTTASQSRRPAGPKINVTRTPMSFTPG